MRIGGTGMALAAMRQIGDAFTAAQPHTTVKILPSLGTGGGLAAVAAGAIDVAVAARGLNDAERAKGLQCFSYAQTPLAFVTHPGVGVSGVTLAEVAAILAGRRLAWPNGTAIRLIRREPSDADWSLLRTLSAEMAEAVQAALERPGLLTPATDQENAESLERLPGSFGAMSIGQLRADPPRHAAHAGWRTADGRGTGRQTLQTGAHSVCRLAQPADRGGRPVPRLPVGRADRRTADAARPHASSPALAHEPTGSNLDPRITRIVTALAAAIALAVGVVLPAAYFLSAYATGHAEIAAEGKLAATAISQLASRNPELWMFENARIRGLLTMLGPLSESERRIVISGAGQEVAAQGDVFRSRS